MDATPAPLVPVGVTLDVSHHPGLALWAYAYRSLNGFEKPQDKSPFLLVIAGTMWSDSAAVKNSFNDLLAR